MSPTSSSRFFAGRTARSATLRTIPASLLLTRTSRGRPGPRCGHSKQSSDRRPSANRGADAPGTFAAVKGAARILAAVVGAAAVALGAGACGGGERQDAGEPAGRYEVAV